MRRAALAMVVTLYACGGTAQTVPIGTLAPLRGSLPDTWTWDGAQWRFAEERGPSPRYFASLAYDADHKQFVLFGGQTAKGSSDETWLWDGKTWRQAKPAHKPDARRAAAWRGIPPPTSSSCTAAL